MAKPQIVAEPHPYGADYGASTDKGSRRYDAAPRSLSALDAADEVKKGDDFVDVRINQTKRKRENNGSFVPSTMPVARSNASSASALHQDSQDPFFEYR